MTQIIQPLRLLITGSRNWSREHWVHIKLAEAMERARGRQVRLVHGGCPEGVDNFAQRWYERERVFNRQLLRPEIHRADWDKGLSGGFRRNERMVRLGAWGVLGFVAPCIKPGCTRNNGQPHGSHGTSHCLKVAKAHNLHIRAWKENW